MPQDSAANPLEFLIADGKNHLPGQNCQAKNALDVVLLLPSCGGLGMTSEWFFAWQKTATKRVKSPNRREKISE
jgi:hypothetical protein